MFGSLVLVLAFLSFTLQAHAGTVTLKWNLNWVNVNPDGELARPAVGINGQWPNPPIQAQVGDRIIINLRNDLGNETASLHFHGIYQQGTNGMDGPPAATQCEIPPGASFTYNFVVNQPGSYWYHSHTAGQLSDGLRGPLIVKDPASPYGGEYSDELVMTVSDWYHDQAPSLIPYYLSPSQNPSGAEPVPYSSLINEAQNVKLNVDPNKTYLVRVISMASFSQINVQFDQHDLTIIAIDGIYVEKRKVSALFVATAQRYDVLLTTKASRDKNYAFLSNLDVSKFPNNPGYLHPNATGYLVYNRQAPLPREAPRVARYDVIDDFTLVPKDGKPLLSGTPDASIVLNLGFFQRDGQNRAGFNNITYLSQKVPSLYTALTTGKDAENPVVYGVNANPYVVKQGDLVELVVNNFAPGGHPLHLHGHAPQLVARAPGSFQGSRPRSLNQTTKAGSNSAAATAPGPGVTTLNMPAVPVRRDTWIIAPGGYTVVRFIADNPGIWLFHCHIEWHVVGGMTATIVEAPRQLQQSQRINPAMESICKQQGVPTAGNAAGNTRNPLDLRGANTVAPPKQRGALVDSSY